MRIAAFWVIGLAELVLVLGPAVGRALMRAVPDGPEPMVWYNPFTWTAVHWTAVAPWAALLVAASAALLVVGQIREARKLRLEQAQPFVMVDFERHPSVPFIIVLVVENLGATAAFDVRLRFTPELQVSSAQRAAKLLDSSLLRNGIPTMPPRKRIDTVFDSMREQLDEGLPQSYQAVVEYRDSAYRTYRETYILDLAWAAGLTYIDRKDIHNVAEHLRIIRGELKVLNRELAKRRSFEPPA
ncbi:hypothetical protein AB0M48_35175 [Lentzea sp. NPDC051208]|uniref:hypothetical protein n=1 Tax=Lentzea sp. NPDC051208 TaxID=3154642 RepID=UPI0034325419